MVLKKAKGGVHSGNTIRCPNSRYKRRYMHDAALVKYVIGKASADYLEEELTPFLQYSVNKKARWTFIKMLKREICCGAHKGADTVVSIAERHKLKRDANCVEFHTTVPKKAKRLRYRTKQQTYFKKSNPVSAGLLDEARSKALVLNEVQLKKLEKVHKSYVAHPPEPEVRYEVFYPTPQKCSLAHNPKYIRDEVLHNFEDAEHSQVSNKKSKTSRRCHKRQYNFDLSDALDVSCDTWQEDDVILEPHALDSSVVPTQQVSYDLDLETLLEEAAVAKAMRLSLETYDRESLTRLSWSSCDGENGSGGAKKYGKGTSVTISKEEVNPLHLEPLNPFLGPRSTKGQPRRPGKVGLGKQVSEEPPKPADLRLEDEGEMKSITVKLQAGQLDPEFLRQQYGAGYVEAMCLPRSFGIDVTTNVTTALVECQGLLKQDLRQLDLETCVVFRVLDEASSTVRVTPKLRLRSRGPVWEMREAKVTVDEVLQAVLATVANIAESEFLTPVTGETPHCSEDSQLQYARTSSLHPTVAFSRLTQDGDAGGAQPPATSCEAPEFCNICFAGVEGGDWLALTGCGHTFCLDCWRQHLITAVQSGALRFTCPEYGCGGVLDKMTSQLLLLPGLQRMAYFRCQQNKVAGSRQFRWCTQTGCGRLLHAPSAVNGEPSDVLCRCGLFVCFNCLQKAHWPAPCGSIARYHEQLKKTGHEEDSPPVPQPLGSLAKLEVFTKKCPHCDRPVEKFGGCPYMLCVCGHAFCWGCRQPWGNHQYNSLCSPDEKLNAKKQWMVHLETSLGEEEEPVKAPQVKHVPNAQWHRKLGKEVKSHSSRKQAEALATKLQSCCMLGTRDVGAGETERLRASVTSARAMKHYVSNLRNLLFQAHHVLEYSYVLRDTPQWTRIPTSLANSILSRLEHTTSLLDNIFFSSDDSRDGSLLNRTDSLLTSARSCLTRLSTHLAPRPPTS